jgi:hypothetical protein
MCVGQLCTRNSGLEPPVYGFSGGPELAAMAATFVSAPFDAACLVVCIISLVLGGVPETFPLLSIYKVAGAAWLCSAATQQLWCCHVIVITY